MYVENDERYYQILHIVIPLLVRQVATVIDYYKRWTSKWPDTKSLSKANLSEVNELWSGLGYYSRGRRLFEGAQKVEAELKGRMPRTAKDLMRELPGVGRYTSCAVASIAYGEPVGLVDGNVVRVMSRMRVIGAESASQVIIFTFPLATLFFYFPCLAQGASNLKVHQRSRTRIIRYFASFTRHLYLPVSDMDLSEHKQHESNLDIKSQFVCLSR